MISELYLKTEKFVIDSYVKQGKEHSIKHFLRTVDWVKQLKPNADEALLIAAVAHDIERAYRKEDMRPIMLSEGFKSLNFIRPHQERGAEITADFLKKEGADYKLIERVKMLISRHEEGGNADQNILKDADSISFFEVNATRFNTHKVKTDGKDKVKEKFDWMYERITIPKAKKICKGLYESALRELSLLYG